MAISPSTLFHFTSKQGLRGILKDNFKLKYCLEKIEIEKDGQKEKPIEVGIPMVSFCDIKISEIKEHIEKYGYYGIGLKKEWAFTKGLNPVLYFNTKSFFSNGLFETLRKIIKLETLNLKDKYYLSNVIRYSKIYEGPLKRKEKLIPNYRFADEREWRYVPDMKDNPEFKHWILKSEYTTKEQKEEQNNKLQNERLYFNANEILYIIVKEEKEINDIINYIKTVKGVNYSSHDIDRLTTRILSCERIMNDF